MLRIALLTLLVACGDGAMSDHVAVGWTGAAPASRGPCKPTAIGAATAVQNTGYNTLLAVAPGETAFDCRDGKLTLVVMQPTKLTLLTTGTATSGTAFVVSVAAAAGDRNLGLGDASVGWTLPPGLREVSRCSEKATCLLPSSVRVIADAAGTYELTARFGALTATTTIVVN
ncbi:MAG TPA: hypothetical protein VGM90_05860 [Kofleriaceae bacterium]|jgi:hypothetical protein